MVPNVGIILIGKAFGAFNVASFAIIVWDYIICLPQEMALIWPTRWSAGKVLYIATRYSAFLDTSLLVYLSFPINHSGLTCQHLFRAAAWLNYFGIIVSEIILIFRTWAVWERNFKLFVILLFIFCSGVISTVIFNQLSPSQATFVSTEQGYPPGCWMFEQPGPALVCGYLAVLVFELIILILTLYQRRQAIVEKRSKLLMTLYRDALWFCFFTALSSLINGITRILPWTIHSELANLPEVQRSLHSVLSARILLNLRQAVHANQLNSTLGSLTLECAASDRGHETTEAGIRTGGSSRNRPRQWHSSRVRVEHNTFGKYFGSIFDLDKQTWTHDEETARRLENERGQPVTVDTLSSQGAHLPA